MTVVLGVDGSRGRWVAARLDGADVRWVVLGTAREAVEAATDASAVGIDVPIGVADPGDRPADIAARARLARSGSSVFATPTRQAFAAARAELARPSSADSPRSVYDCWAVAHAAQRSTHPRGTGFSKQAWGLAAGILDVDRALATASAGDLGIVDRVVEVHPECSFRAMDRLTGVEADGTTGAGTRNWPGKKSAAGAAARLSLLGPALGTDPLTVLADPALAGVPLDDAVDALAAAWTARRWAEGTAEVLGDPIGTRTGWSPSGAVTSDGQPLRLAQRIVV